MKKIAKLVFPLATLAVVCAALWFYLHTDEYDPKNFHYVCWKHGLCQIDRQRAISVMVHDPSASQIVIGKTRGQLQEKFGFLTPLDQVSPYLQKCYRGSAYAGSDVAFLRRSDWMVLFNNGNAVDLVLVKGC